MLVVVVVLVTRLVIMMNRSIITRYETGAGAGLVLPASLPGPDINNIMQFTSVQPKQL